MPCVRSRNVAHATPVASTTAAEATTATARRTIIHGEAREDARHRESTGGNDAPAWRVTLSGGRALGAIARPSGPGKLHHPAYRGLTLVCAGERRQWRVRRACSGAPSLSRSERTPPLSVEGSSRSVVAREGVVAITLVRAMEGCRWWSLMVW